MNRHQHNLLPGHIRQCQICGSQDLDLVIDLGHQPLCDSLPTKSQNDEPETFYPLRLVRCRICALAQLDYAVEASQVYHPAYPYKSGVTKELVGYQRTLAQDLCRQTNLAAGSLVVDIGSNDGTLLTGFQARGFQVFGVEPTNIAQLANQEGVPTLQSSFDNKAAEQIVAEKGHAKLITATNVFAHMTGLGDVLEAMLSLLDDDGLIMIENHYLLQVIDRTQYDTIYHEHLRTYSLKSLVTLFSMYDLVVFHAVEVSRYGGNIRILVSRKGKRTPDGSVTDLLNRERTFGLYGSEVYERFADRTRKSRRDLLTFFLGAQERGERIVGNSCPGRCSTLLNYVGIDTEFMPYIAEQPTSLKLGRYLPGKHIPIVDNEILVREQPHNVMLLAWHYAEAIAEQLRAKGVRSRLTVPLPELKTFEI